MNDRERYRAVATAVAERAGASAIAFTSADALPLAHARMAAAFARGDFTTWPYDDRHARDAADPGRTLAGARSVVCVALAYAHPPPAGRAPQTGRISNYAWAADYHPIVRAICTRIARALDDAAGHAVTRTFCDTAPLAERALAERAGLGWIGKHTSLIVPGAGSCVFLGEVVTSLDLGVSAASKKSCGSCRRCVSACPTGALRGDYTIDATRCIADLTQRTDAVPAELRPLLGDWVWGCDLCGDACPPSQRATVPAHEAFTPQPGAASVSLVDLLNVRGASFKRRFRPTAMGWRGPAVLRRNAAIALGNGLDRASVPALVAALSGDSHALVRRHAAWALGRIGSPAALRALAEREHAESDAVTRAEIAAARDRWKPWAPDRRYPLEG